MNVRMKLVDVHHKPVLARGMPGTEDNDHGFEGGIVIKERSTYHLFVTEVCGSPDSDHKFSYTRLAHWHSPDGLNFERLSTVIEPNLKAPNGLSHRMPWTPYPIFDEEEQRWQLFFVGYGGEISNKIIRAQSVHAGREGLAGPYREHSIVMDPTDADEWDSGGVVSFFPFRVGDSWRAFYGSNSIGRTGETRDDWLFEAGLATSPSLRGPWKRLSHLNPVKMDDRFIENPVVHRIAPNCYIAMYDGETTHGIAYAWSADGEQWSRERVLWLDSPPTPWAWFMRTPLGLVLEDEATGIYALYYTAFDGKDHDQPKKPLYHCGFGAVGRIRVRFEIQDAEQLTPLLSKTG